MPDNVVALIEKIWKDKIKGAGGNFLVIDECGKRRRIRRLFSFLFCTGVPDSALCNGREAA